MGVGEVGGGSFETAKQELLRVVQRKSVEEEQHNSIS